MLVRNNRAAIDNWQQRVLFIRTSVLTLLFLKRTTRIRVLGRGCSTGLYVCFVTNLVDEWKVNVSILLKSGILSGEFNPEGRYLKEIMKLSWISPLKTMGRARWCHSAQWKRESGYKIVGLTQGSKFSPSLLSLREVWQLIGPYRNESQSFHLCLGIEKW